MPFPPLYFFSVILVPGYFINSVYATCSLLTCTIRSLISEKPILAPMNIVNIKRETQILYGGILLNTPNKNPIKMPTIGRMGTSMKKVKCSANNTHKNNGTQNPIRIPKKVLRRRSPIFSSEEQQ